MSYAVIPPRGALGEDLPRDLSLLKTGLAPMPTPADTFNQILASSPIPDEVKAEWAPINAAVSGSPLANLNFDEIQKDPSKAINGLAQAMPDVLGNMGIDPGDLGSQLLTIAAGNVGTLVNGQPGPVVHAAIATSASYACLAVGIPPELGTLAVDAVWNGEINENTIEAAGAVTGAIAGGALGCFIGLPPIIGAFIGSIAGKAVGSLMSDVFDVGYESAKKAAQAEWNSLFSSTQNQLTGVRDQYINILMAHRGEYWALFDRIIDNISFQWQVLECNSTYARFPLLWSGSGNVNPYFLYPFTPSLCATPINQNLSRGTGCLNSKGTLPNVLGGGCGAIYGCPYPAFPDMGTNDPYRERVVQAFAAYDIWWVPPEQRQAIDSQWAQFFAQPGNVSTDLKWNNHTMGVFKSLWESPMHSGATSAIPYTKAVENLSRNARQMDIAGYPTNGAVTDYLKKVNYKSAYPSPFAPCPPYVDPKGFNGCQAFPFNAWMTFWSDYRGHCKDYAPRHPNDCEVMCDREVKSTLNAYQAQLLQTMSSALDLRSIQAAAVRIGADLVSSCGVYTGAAAVNANRSSLIKGNLDKAIAQSSTNQSLILNKNQQMRDAVRYGKLKNSFVNYSALAMGGALLGAAMLRGRR